METGRRRAVPPRAGIPGGGNGVRPPGRAHHGLEVDGLRRLMGPLAEAEVEALLQQVGRVRVDRGGTVVRQGEPSDAVFLLVSGRMRAVREADGERVVGEIMPGESIGEMGFFTGKPRTATVYAVRDSELIRLPHADFERLLTTNATVALGVARVVVDRLHDQYATPTPRPPREIAVLPLTASVRASVPDLVRALERHGPVRLVDRAAVPGASVRGRTAGSHDADAEVRMAAWLDERTADAGYTVYVTDPEPTAWSRLCLNRADQVVLVADAAAAPALHPLEREVLRLGPRVSAPRRTLVLVHAADTALPTGTAAWLEPRDVDEHYHLRGTGRAELDRLARYLSGTSIGVVLGGGGARGWSHIGVLRALEEAGVPVDRIGGTSMGAIVSAVRAMGRSDREIVGFARTAWLELRPHKEYTFPLFSLLRGRKVTQATDMVFGDVQVEDLWIPYYSISTNITTAEMRVHRRGPLTAAVTASAALPGVLTPVVDDGDLLVDGGVLNNVPVDVMHESGAGPVIAVDVSGDRELQFEGTAFPSPWQVLRDRILGRRTTTAPRLGEVLVRCTTLGSASRRRAAVRSADLYLEPPVKEIGLMDFERLDEAVELGYGYARERLPTWWETVEGRRTQVAGPDA